MKDGGYHCVTKLEEDNEALSSICEIHDDYLKVQKKTLEGEER